MYTAPTGASYLHKGGEDPQCAASIYEEECNEGELSCAPGVKDRPIYSKGHNEEFIACIR